MNLKQLETFVRVAELGSFSKAALVLDTVQPALSRQVRQLEIDLRVTLLQRTGRGVVLTAAGQRLLEHSVGILQLVARAREAVQATRDEPAGRIVVGMPPSVGRRLTLPLVEAFGRECPKARLAIVEGLSAHLVEWIANGRVDVGLVHNPEPNDAIDTEPVLDEALCLVSASRTRGVAAGKAVSLKDLPKYPLVIPERSHAVRRLLETQAALAGIRLDIAWEVSSVPAMLELVAGGHGHAVLTRAAVGPEVAAGRLAVRAIGAPPLVNTLCLATSASKRATPLTRHVTRLLRELVALKIAVGNPTRKANG
jgi:LysR family transcriptional regulator, nitrogen assimilation regulatory protein